MGAGPSGPSSNLGDPEAYVSSPLIGRYPTRHEFKLAKNSSLPKNLKHQVEAYQKASDAKHALKVIVFFTADEESKTHAILRDLGLEGHPDIVLIDARADNKPSASRIGG